MSEARQFWNALRFLTVIPAPGADHVEDDWLIRAAKYFPLVGIIVGGCSALVLLLAAKLWTGFLPPLLAVAAGIALTGALHEDGLADTADGLGGGRSRETRLAIMKDSRIGTYGALALGLGVALRVFTLAALPIWAGAAALLGVHAGSRLAAAAVMTVLPYAGDPGATKLTYTEAPWRGAEIAMAAALHACGTAAVGTNRRCCRAVRVAAGRRDSGMAGRPRAKTDRRLYRRRVGRDRAIVRDRLPARRGRGNECVKRRAM